MRILAALFALNIALPAQSHEFWIEPLNYQIAPEGMMQAELVNGQFFEGSKLAYLPQRFLNFDMSSGMRRQPVENRLGARPALDNAPFGDGLHVISYTSQMATVNYSEWDKFLAFAEHKAFEGIEAAHDARGLPRDGFDEGYWRLAKTLIGVGNAAGSDFRTGLITEFVALDNPYTDDVSGGMRFQLFYRDDIRANAQVELYQKPAEGGETVITIHQTDAEGIVTVPVEPGYSYLVDAVVLRVPTEQQMANTGIVWETLWASTTFQVAGDAQ
ncbi:MAG: DUF4198 domain-containing protein [Octadecabacter sp.]|nr:DUF4198 domain-containing protein [Octadecabacter sp.]